MTPKIIAVAYGTRPEAIKLIPLILALEREVDLDPRVIVSGQHPEMVAQAHAAFGVTSDRDLVVERDEFGVGSLTGRMIQLFAADFTRSRPDTVVVQGDTASAFAAALAAFTLQIPVVHVEAGLRSGDLRNPFPEEALRQMISRIADVHAAPTRQAADNLLAEGIPERAIAITGNTIVDAFALSVALEHRVGDARVTSAIEAGRRLVVVTAHRRESWGDKLANIAAAIGDLAGLFPDVVFVVPLHPNPVVRAQFEGVRRFANVLLIEPVSYPEMAALLDRAVLAISDSGGIQEEVATASTPLLITREVTERMEIVTAGGAELVGTDRAYIVRRARMLLNDERRRRAMTGVANPFGDGRASARIVALIRELNGLAAVTIERSAHTNASAAR